MVGRRGDPSPPAADQISLRKAGTAGNGALLHHELHLEGPIQSGAEQVATAAEMVHQYVDIEAQFSGDTPQRRNANAVVAKVAHDGVEQFASALEVRRSGHSRSVGRDEAVTSRQWR